MYDGKMQEGPLMRSDTTTKAQLIALRLRWDAHAIRQPPTFSILKCAQAPIQAFMPVWALFVVPGTFSPWAAAPRRPSFWKEHPPEQNERSAA